jgi:hypothetical protein
MEERPPVWRVAANILNKQSRTAEKEWSSRRGVVRGVKNFSRDAQNAFSATRVQTEVRKPVEFLRC